MHNQKELSDFQSNKMRTLAGNLDGLINMDELIG